jgi:hypothetical protein
MFATVTAQAAAMENKTALPMAWRGAWFMGKIQEKEGNVLF